MEAKRLNFVKKSAKLNQMPAVAEQVENSALSATFSDELKALMEAVRVQTPHPYYGVLSVHRNGDGRLGWKYSDQPRDMIQPASLEEIIENLRELERQKVMSGLDRFNYGVWFPTWEENLWEIARLRIRCPGVPVHFLASGSNGSGKSEFAAGTIVRAIMTTTGREFLCLTDDEPKSKMVQQKKFYQNLPNEPYKNERGRTKTTARGKMGYTDVGGFTENEFGAQHGGSCKFRFWSASVTSMEGIRPYFVWSDEEIPLEWLEAVDRRLLTAAEGSKEKIEQWKRVLEDHEKEPWRKFPRDKIGELMQGVHLITWTPSQGRTNTVNKFQDDGRVMEMIEADRDLLPVVDAGGRVIGGERMARLIYGKDPAYVTRMMYAWENPMGGNFEGMKAKALQKRSKKLTRWWIYGITERTGGSPFSNFMDQVHVRPRKGWLPINGTYYMTIDPVASGGKCWTMGIFKVAADQQGYIAPGDIVMVHEYPQVDDCIPGVGFPDDWCQPGGKDGRGIAGNIQHAVKGGFEFKANEIRRLWDKIGEWECEADAGRPKGPIKIPNGNIIMDSRAANTEKENESESKTIIEWMEDVGIYCVPAGRGSGAQVGETYIAPGEQMIQNALAYDVENCELDAATGFMVISPLKGKGPKLWIMDHCTNTIMALKNYPGIAAGGRTHMMKDFVDLLRYLVIADPRHFDSQSMLAGVQTGGW